MARNILAHARESQGWQILLPALFFAVSFCANRAIITRGNGRRLTTSSSERCSERGILYLDSEQQLLEAARGGDEEAFLLIFDRYQDLLFRFAFRLLGTGAIAEDLVQECFLALLRGTGRYDSKRGSLKVYLYGILRNLARRHYRRRNVEVALEDCAEPVAPGTGDEHLVRQEVCDVVQAAVMRLPFPQREVLVLFSYEELSLDEIARSLKVDIGTVKSRLHRAREKLRTVLSRHSIPNERN